MRSVAKNTLKGVGHSTKPPDAPLFATTVARQRERRCRQSWQGVQPDSEGLKPWSFIVNSVVISVIISIVISVVIRE